LLLIYRHEVLPDHKLWMLYSIYNRQSLLLMPDIQPAQQSLFTPHFHSFQFSIHFKQQSVIDWINSQNKSNHHHQQDQQQCLPSASSPPPFSAPSPSVPLPPRLLSSSSAPSASTSPPPRAPSPTRMLRSSRAPLTVA
jgi:hypothetical protein